MKLSKILFLMGSLYLMTNCRIDNNSEPPLFELLSPEKTGVTFINRLVEDDSLNVMEFDYMYNGGGVAIGDFNNDGLPDIFFTGNKVSCRLYINKGDMEFEDITEKAGLSTTQWAEGVTLVDLNNDGYLDIYISTSNRFGDRKNRNLLFMHNGMNEEGIPVFTEKASEYGIDDTGYNTQAAFFDYDKDGHLDLFILSNAIETYKRNSSRPRDSTGSAVSNDKLYRNNGDGTFTDVSIESGIVWEGYGLGLAISDINKDGWPDIYIANDFITNDILYMNNGDGTFTNEIAKQLKHQSLNGMGTDVADFNNDGLMDIVVLDMMPADNLRQKTMFSNINYDRYMLDIKSEYEPQFVRNTLQLNNGNGTFSEIGQLAGIFKTDWSWAPLFADFDNDGLKDLFVTNGYGKDVTDLDYIMYSKSIPHFGTENSKKERLRQQINKLEDIKIPNYVFKNNGDITFTDKSADWGIVHPSLSNGMAFADLDNDGDLDIIINNVNDVAFIYQNNADKNPKALNKSFNNLKIRLKGDSLNLQGLGSKISLSYLEAGVRKKQYYEHYLTRGYKSTVDHNIHFGLGTATIIDSLEIIWPDGKYELLVSLPVNDVFGIEHRNSKVVEIPLHKFTLQNFELVTDIEGLNHRHQSDDVVDFKVQPLLPHKHSENGPGIAVGDVNGNGLDDFYIGGSANYPGKLFIQNADGSFYHKLIEENPVYDDMGALFFDADNDGDLDLYVVSGGSRYKENALEYQDRLFINDGMGNFTLAPQALPEILTSGSVVIAADYDMDGDLDLFVGGRVIPGKYPLPPKSYILRNDGGIFKDVTEEVCPELQNLGMVTSALWSDYDQDQQPDLVLVGEWMPITIFNNEAGKEGARKFNNVTSSAGLASSSGWWNSIVEGDFDKDGHIDYIAGNLGLNSRYSASIKEPLSIYAKDFDGNGSIDPIMFHYIDHEAYPVHPRDALIEQVPYMRKKFTTYLDYGKTNLSTFFTNEELIGVYHLSSYHLQTSLIKNNGNHTFTVQPLPNEVQVAPVNGIITKDFSGNGNLDILMVGNSYATETHTGRYDASVGHYLEGDGKGKFMPKKVNTSGFFVDGNARGMATIKNPLGENIILVAQFGDSLKVFRQRINKL